MSEPHAFPHFLIIGAEKAGTTSLYTYLNLHPQITMCRRREPAFFCKPEIYARGWDWYVDQFGTVAEGQVVGEASPQYSIDCDFPGTAERIFHDLPDVKLLYIVRHPVRRLESAWMHYRCHGRRRLGQTVFPILHKAVHAVQGLIDASSYWRQLSLYRECFPDEQILLLFLEDLSTDSQTTMKRIFEFLDVAPSVSLDASALTPQNVTLGRRVDRDWVNWLRRVPGINVLDRLGRKTPLRSLGNRILRRQIIGRPIWNPKVLAWVEDQLRDDARSLLEYAGKPMDFWDLAVSDSLLPRLVEAGRGP